MSHVVLVQHYDYRSSQPKPLAPHPPCVGFRPEGGGRTEGERGRERASAREQDSTGKQELKDKA